MHVARSAAGAACALWQLVHVACDFDAWSASSFDVVWHDRQAGTLATPAGPAGASGPCGRWQLAQATGACGPCVFCAWQVVHVAFGAREEGCASWQIVHFAWPAGAVFASSAWQLPQAGLGAVGACGSWQPLQAVWPRPPAATAAALSRAWQVEQAGALATVNSCGLWQVLHAV